MPNPDQSVTLCKGKKLKVFLFQRKADDLCFFEINIFRVTFFDFLPQIKVKTFFSEIYF